jgi:hypothetical protein
MLLLAHTGNVLEIYIHTHAMLEAYSVTNFTWICLCTDAIHFPTPFLPLAIYISS